MCVSMQVVLKLKMRCGVTEKNRKRGGISGWDPVFIKDRGREHPIASSPDPRSIVVPGIERRG